MLFLEFGLQAPVVADDAHVLGRAADRPEIEHLLRRYVRVLDTLDAEASAAVFTAR
jgi:hypothetical protein